MPLEATFSLTPRESFYSVHTNQMAELTIQGADFYPKYNEFYPFSFDKLHADDRLYFSGLNTADPTLDYTVYDNRRMTPHIQLHYDLSLLGTHKELALVFSFEAQTESRLLIFTDDGLLSDETLVVGDNQFLVEVEALDALYLYFIPAHLASSNSGGSWIFKGVTGYVV